MNFIPLGPPTHKKPKPKPIKFINDEYGYISCEDELIAGTELFAVDIDGQFQPVQTGFYVLISGDPIEIVDGIIC
jgi:hypothetical protein